MAQHHSDFLQAIDNIRSVGKGILNLENKEFDHAFCESRTRMKELDRRSGSVIVQGFDDAVTVSCRFRLLDSFDNLITRPIVADELEKLAALIGSLYMDLMEVQQNFVDHCEQLKSYDKKILDREDTREVVIKVYTSLLGNMADVENKKISEWGKSIEASSQSKLRDPLLRREMMEVNLLGGEIVLPGSFTANGSATVSMALIFVNFDPLLVQLLREVKYFVLLGLQIPEMAMEIYQVVSRQDYQLDSHQANQVVTQVDNLLVSHLVNLLGSNLGSLRVSILDSHLVNQVNSQLNNQVDGGQSTGCFKLIRSQ